jgi:lipoyl(octanoyl) transferase
MAVDATLLERAVQSGEGWLRLYTWEPHCLSFGRHEPATRRYDVARIREMGLDTVRRPTGGRAVWHSSELTYAIAAPCRRLGSLQDAYLEIHRMIAEALQQLGLAASLAPRTRAAMLDAGACFAQAAGGEVLVEGQKVVGSAQLRRGGALLQHGSILLRDEQQLIGELSGGAPRLNPPGLSRPSPALPVHELRQVIARTARSRWPGAWTLASPEQVLQSASARQPRFRSAA